MVKKAFSTLFAFLADVSINLANIVFISPKQLQTNIKDSIDLYIQKGLNVTPAEELKKKFNYVNLSSTLIKNLAEINDGNYKETLNDLDMDFKLKIDNIINKFI